MHGGAACGDIGRYREMRTAAHGGTVAQPAVRVRGKVEGKVGGKVRAEVRAEVWGKVRVGSG